MSNLDMPTTSSCAFCDYLNKTRPFTILTERQLSAALVTREQRGVSHVLVVSRRHVPSILELSEQEAGEVMVLTRDVARAIDAVDGRPGISIWQNNGTAADQAIPHFHIHVAGTLPTGSTNRGAVPELSVDETDAIADRLRPAM